MDNSLLFMFVALCLFSIFALSRLRDPGQPFIAFDPGMTRDALARYGCAELFQVFASIPDCLLCWWLGTLLELDLCLVP